MIKRILLPLDNSAYSEVAMKTACLLARLHDAEVTALVVLDTKSIENSIGPIPAGYSYYHKELQKSFTKQAKQHIDDIVIRFKELAASEKIQYQLHSRQGLPATKILEESMFFDLMVVGLKTYYKFDKDNEPGDSFDELLDHSVTPVLAVPKDFNPGKIADPVPFNIIIAFNGSLPSARALQRFGQFNFTNNVNLRIIMSDENEKLTKHYLEDASEFLDRHNFTSVELIGSSNNIISEIESNHYDWAYMIVLGAHSKRGIFDFMVGSLSKHIIRKCDKPVFLGQ